MTVNPHRGEIEITLAGEKRTIRITTNVIAKAEILNDRSLLTGLVSFGFRELRAILCAALQKDEPKLTLEQTGDLIDKSDEGEVMLAVVTAWNAHLRRNEKDPEPESADPQKTATPGTGTGS